MSPLQLACSRTALWVWWDNTAKECCCERPKVGMSSKCDEQNDLLSNVVCCVSTRTIRSHHGHHVRILTCVVSASWCACRSQKLWSASCKNIRTSRPLTGHPGTQVSLKHPAWAAKQSAHSWRPPRSVHGSSLNTYKKPVPWLF